MAKNPKNNQPFKFFLFLAGLIMLGLMFQTLSPHSNDKKTITFSEFMRMVDLPDDNIEHVVKVTIKRTDQIEAVTKENTSFTVNGPKPDAELWNKFLARKIEVVFEPEEESSLWKSLLFNSIPMLLLLFLFFFFMRQLQVGGGKAMSFGKSRAKLQNDSRKKLTFKDVAGVDEAKAELEEIVDFLKDPKKFTKLGGRIPKGVLLVGPPGTGKTILAKAISGEADVPFFSISGSEFVEMFVGVGASRVRDLFDQAKKNAPCIVFIDEIDAVGRQRGAGLGGGHDEREQTLNQLLVEMDGFEANEGVILIAATNRVDVLDPALLRPGRFDRRVFVPKPDIKGRQGILKVHSRKTPLSNSVDLRVIAQGTPGFSGADLENLVNEAALIAARGNNNEVSMLHLEQAKDKVMMGPERRSMVISEKEKRNTSFHESGHCIVARLVPGTDPVHKITIIPRGQALGVTMLLPEEDQLTISKENAEGIIAYAMGGRAAEQLVFGQMTTGAGSDIENATSIARKMVCHWGMSEKVGPMAVGGHGQEVFLGREMATHETISNKMLECIDDEVKRFVFEGYDRAVKILGENRKILDNMAEALLVRETLDAKEIEVLMSGQELITNEERKQYELRKEQFAKHASEENDDEEKKKQAKDSADEDKSSSAAGGLKAMPCT